MDLLFLLAIVLSLAGAEYAPTDPAALPLLQAAAALALCAFVPLLTQYLGTLSIRQILAAPLENRKRIVHRLATRHQIMRLAWLATVAVSVFWLQWPVLIDTSFRLRKAILLDDILLIAPFLASWWAMNACMFHTRSLLRALRFGRRVPKGLWTESRRAATVMLRSLFGLTVAPALILLSMRDLVSLLPVGEHPLAYLATTGVVVLLFPLALRHFWRTVRLADGEARQRLETCARQANVRLREIVVWQTNNMIQNAAITGWHGRMRTVFLSDGLLSALSLDELEAVFRHELGHARHGHARWRLACICAPLGLFLSIQVLLPGTSDVLEALLLNPVLAPFALLLIILMLLAYLATVFRFHSHQLELQADLAAVGARPGSHCEARCPGPAHAEMPAPVETYLLALAKLDGATGAGESEETMQHPSMARRSRWLRRAVLEPSVGQRLAFQLRTVHLLLLLAIASPLMAILAKQAVFAMIRLF